MKQKIKNVLIFIGVILTLPIWIIFVVIILFAIPKDFYDRIDEGMEV